MDIIGGEYNTAGVLTKGLFCAIVFSFRNHQPNRRQGVIVRKTIHQTLFWTGLLIILFGYAIRAVAGETVSDGFLVFGAATMAAAEGIRKIRITRQQPRLATALIVPGRRRRSHWSYQLRR
jgi:hypothetical protein